MSTKTTIKRIALVAAVAAALGGLSTVAANASEVKTVSSIALAGGDVVNSTTVGGIAGPANTVTVKLTQAIDTDTAGGSNHYNLLADYVTVSGAGSVITSAAASAGSYFGAFTPASNGASAVVSELVQTSYNAPTALSFNISTPATGSIVVNVYDETADGSGLFASTPSSTKTITVNATSVAGTVSVANSKVLMSNDTASTGSGSTFSAPTSDSTVLAATNAGSHVGTIRVILNDTESTTQPISGDSISASVSGAGLVAGVAGNGSDTISVPTITAAVGKAATATTASNGVVFFGIYGDGTSGVGTITISQGTAVLATKTITFYSSTVASLVVTQNKYVISTTAGSTLGSASTGTANSGALTIAAKDSNGNLVANLSTTIGSTGWFATSDNTSCVSSTIPASGVASDNSSGNGVGYYQINLGVGSAPTSGCAANVTISFYNSSTSTITTSSVKITAGAATITTLALTTDSPTYLPGQLVTLTLTAKDSSGNSVADGSYGVWYDAANPLASGATVGGTGLAPVTASAQLTSNPFAIASTSTSEVYSIKNGVATSTFFAPYTDGTVNLTSTLAATNTNSSKLATALLGTTLTTSFSVSTGASNAANNATDAANAATDAANNAIDAANAAADTAQTAADAAQSAADTATQALAAAQDANQNATDALAAAQEATDAGNAATDAANAAADSADAATAAAQDASDKAAAALAAVTQLSAQFTTLAAQVAKVLTAVQAIAKATTPAKKK